MNDWSRLIKRDFARLKKESEPPVIGAPVKKLTSVSLRIGIVCRCCGSETEKCVDSAA